MTVSNSNARIAYSGDGSTTAFAAPFRIIDQSHVRVVLVSSTGTETVQTITTHYTVSGVGNSSFTVTMVTAPASGTKLIIRRYQPFTQGYDYVANDDFPAETHEAALDLRTMENIQNQSDISRAIRLTDGDTSGADVTLPQMGASVASKFLRVATDGLSIDFADAVYDNGNFTLTGTGTVERTVDGKLADFVSAMDFGCAADGVTDDTAALRYAINHCATYGKDLWIPAGRYAVSSFVVGYDASLNTGYPATPKPFRIMFEGRAGNAQLDFIDNLTDSQYQPGAWLVQLSSSTLAVPLVYFRPSSSGNYNNRCIEIVGLKAVAKTSDVVVDGRYVWEWTIRDMRVKNIYQYGNGVIIDNYEKCIFEDWMILGAKDDTTYPMNTRGGTVGLKLTYQDIDGSSTQVRNILCDKWTTGYVEGEQIWRKSYTFVGGGTNTITDNAVTETMMNAIRVGDTVTITGSVSNNGTHTVTAVDALGVTITVSTALTNEAAVTCNLEHNNGYEFHNHDVKQSMLMTQCYYGAVLGGAQTGQSYIGCQFRGENVGLAIMKKQHNATFVNLDCAAASGTTLAGSYGLYIGYGPTAGFNDIRNVIIDGLFCQKNQHLVRIEGTGGNGGTVRGITINGAELNVTNTAGYSAIRLNGTPNDLRLRSVNWNNVQSLFSGSGSAADVTELIDVGHTSGTYYAYQVNGATLEEDSTVDHSFIGGGVSSVGLQTETVGSTTLTARTASNIADNGVGLIRVTTSTDHQYATGDSVTLSGGGDATLATAIGAGAWTITRIGTATFDLDGSTFAGAYAATWTCAASGGSIDLDATGSGFDRGFDNFILCSTNGGNLRFLLTTLAQAGDTVRIRFTAATPPTIIDTDQTDGIRLTPNLPGGTTRAITKGETLTFTHEANRWHLNYGG